MVEACAAIRGLVMEVAREPEAEETLKAKMAGRWRDGTTLIAAPDFSTWKAVRDGKAAPPPRRPVT